MPEESAVMNATPAGRVLRTVKGIAPKARVKVSAEKPERTMTGPGFWILTAVTAFDELIFDPLANLSVVFSIFVFFTGPLVFSLTAFYLWFSGVRMDVRKVASMAVTVLIEIVPLLSIIPTALLNLAYIRHLEHKKYKEKLKEYKKKVSPEPRVGPSRA